MTISLWRYSHLALAVSSFLFIILASVTGIVLALEPVSKKLQPYEMANDQINLDRIVPMLKSQYPEISKLSVDHSGFVVVEALDENFENATFYIDPETGKSLGNVESQNEFFQWVTNLHRSLFLQGLGRFFMGLTSFLLLLIAISGSVLIIQRQQGIRKFFRKIVKENFEQYYHVYLGRLSLIPIIIIAATGTYLSLAQFGIGEETPIVHEVNPEAINQSPKINTSDFQILKDTPLTNVASLEFPFSEDVEDFFTLKLKDRELIVNQITGEILSEKVYSQATALSRLSMDLHTGRSSIIWAIILLIASANILFFVYSGFMMTLRRKSHLIRNKFTKDSSKFIILVGSENGSTYGFAKIIHEQLIKNGQTSFLTELDKFSVYPSAEHLIVITATYGIGDAPANAKRFLQKLEQNPQPNPVKFSVLGFGSHSYADFCQFAFIANNALSAQKWAIPFVEIHTVNDKSRDEFSRWVTTWTQKAHLPEFILPEKLQPNPGKLIKCIVNEKSADSQDGTFILRLKPKKKAKFTSGDLVAVYPQNDHRERLYSIGKVNDEIQLCVKLHPNGFGSGYLHGLDKDQDLKVHIVRNKSFHFPSKVPSVIMIGNGTGIAPFIGMINQNKRKTETHLYCGFRGSYSVAPFYSQLQRYVKSRKLNGLHLAYSREGEKQYVQQLLERDAKFIAESLANGSTIMICGSLTMQKGVVGVLGKICSEYNETDLSYYQTRGQVLMDCY